MILKERDANCKEYVQEYYSNVGDVVDVGLFEHGEPVLAHAQLMLNLASCKDYRVELQSGDALGYGKLPLEIVNQRTPQGFRLAPGELIGISIEPEYCELEF